MNIARVFYFLISAALGIAFYIQYQLFLRIDNINNSIENLKLKNDEKLADVYKLVFESHFKDDLVLSGFNISTTIIIAFFTALIALGAVFSFKKIDEEIKELKTTSNKIYDLEIEINNLYSKILKSEKKVSTQVTIIEDIKERLLDNIIDTSLNNAILQRKNLRILILEFNSRKQFKDIDIIKLGYAISNYFLSNSIFLLHLEENEDAFIETYGSLNNAIKEIESDMEQNILVLKLIESKLNQMQKDFLIQNMTELNTVETFETLTNEIKNIFTNQ